VAGGVALGILLAIAGRIFGGWAAKVRASGAAKRLKESVAAVAETRIVEPVEVEITRLKAFNAALKAARTS